MAAGRGQIDGVHFLTQRLKLRLVAASAARGGQVAIGRNPFAAGHGRIAGVHGLITISCGQVAGTNSQIAFWFGQISISAVKLQVPAVTLLLVVPASRRAVVKSREFLFLARQVKCNMAACSGRRTPGHSESHVNSGLDA